MMRDAAERAGGGLRTVIVLAEGNDGTFAVTSVTCGASPMHVIGLASSIPAAVSRTYEL